MTDQLSTPIGIFSVEQQVFQHTLLLALIKHGLPQSAAASVCTETADHLHQMVVSPPMEGLKSKLIEKYEDMAAALLGRDPLPKG